MATFSAVSLSNIEYVRLDADFYRPHYLEDAKLWQRIGDKIGAVRLSHLITTPVRTGRTPSERRLLIDDVQVTFVKTDGVREGTINFESAGILPNRVLNRSDIIDPDSVVMTIIGATPDIVGRAAIIRANDPVCVTNQNVAVIKTNDKCDPYFLLAYLQTKLGRNQVWRHSRRTGQVNLNCREVERIIVPLFIPEIQRQIGNQIRRALAAADDAVRLVHDAQRLLEDEIGIIGGDGGGLVFSCATASTAFDAGRIDAEYFNPHFSAVRQQVFDFKHGFTSLNSICRSIRPNFDPKAASGTTQRYIELSNLNSVLGTVDGYIVCPSEELPSRARRRVSAGDVLISSVAGSLDRAAMVSESEVGCIASTGFFQLRPVQVSSEFLLILTKSYMIRTQMMQEATGGILSAVPESRLRRIMVPKVPQDMQDLITSHVRESYAKRDETRQLLEQAKARVEQLIEEAVAA